MSSLYWWRQLKAWWRGDLEDRGRPVIPEQVREGEFRIPLPHRKEMLRGADILGEMTSMGLQHGRFIVSREECGALLKALRETGLRHEHKKLYSRLERLMAWYSMHPTKGLVEDSNTAYAGPRPAVWGSGLAEDGA